MADYDQINMPAMVRAADVMYDRLLKRSLRGAAVYLLCSALLATASVVVSRYAIDGYPTSQCVMLWLLVFAFASILLVPSRSFRVNALEWIAAKSREEFEDTATLDDLERTKLKRGPSSLSKLCEFLRQGLCARCTPTRENYELL